MPGKPCFARSSSSALSSAGNAAASFARRSGSVKAGAGAAGAKSCSAAGAGADAGNDGGSVVTVGGGAATFGRPDPPHATNTRPTKTNPHGANVAKIPR